MSYRIMVLPEKDDMPVEVIQKLEGLVRAGATIVGPKPVRTRSLTDYPRCDKTVKKTDYAKQKLGIDQTATG